jgi:hypothetical protein
MAREARLPTALLRFLYSRQHQAEAATSESNIAKCPTVETLRADCYRGHSGHIVEIGCGTMIPSREFASRSA